MPIRAMAERLGMRVTRASRYSASMGDTMNALVVMGPPRPGVILNGRRIAEGAGIVAIDGQLAVPASLPGVIRPRLRRRPSPPVKTPADPVEVPNPWPPPVGGTVVLDPGHGGKDPGAPNRYGPYEKHIVLAVARRVRDGLRRRNIQVIMTRQGDTFIELEQRAAIANRAGADVFVSIHADAAKNTSARGCTVYIQRQADAGSRALGEALSGSLSGCAASRGVRRADYRVLVHTTCPAALVELGYLTNPTESRKLATQSHQQRLAGALAESIAGFLNGRR